MGNCPIRSGGENWGRTWSIVQSEPRGAECPEHCPIRWRATSQPRGDPVGGCAALSQVIPLCRSHLSGPRGGLGESLKQGCKMVSARGWGREREGLVGAGRKRLRAGSPSTARGPNPNVCRWPWGGDPASCPACAGSGVSGRPVVTQMRTAASAWGSGNISSWSAPSSGQPAGRVGSLGRPA